MELKFLLDTNTVIYLCDGTLPQNALDFLRNEVKKGVNISVITQIEVFSWQFPTTEIESIMQTFVYGSTIFRLSRAVVYKTIEIRKGRKIKLPDAIIAATALVHDFTLVSRNDADFKRIPDLKYVNPFTDL